MNPKCIGPMDNVLTNLVCRSTISHHTVGTLTHTCLVSTIHVSELVIRKIADHFARQWGGGGLWGG